MNFIIRFYSGLLTTCDLVDWLKTIYWRRIAVDCDGNTIN